MFLKLNWTKDHTEIKESEYLVQQFVTKAL